MFTVVALDPGGTTGWASYQCNRMYNPLESRYEYVDEDWNCGQLGPGEHHNDLDLLLGTFHTTDYNIVCERFEYRNRSRAGLDLSSREYIGVTKRFCQDRGVDLWLQSAAQAKGFVKDAHLKKLDLWSSSYKHAMDANRHLLFWLTNSYHDKDFAKELLSKAWR